MPMDTLIKINEIQAKIAMDLESKRGALRDLGAHFPDQKMREIFEEMLEDTKEQGALQLIRSQIAAFTMIATGMTPDGQPLMTADAEGNPVPASPPVDPALAQEMHGPGLRAGTTTDASTSKRRTPDDTSLRDEIPPVLDVLPVIPLSDTKENL